MDLDALQAALRDRSPKLVYTMPSFQNPAGVTTGQPHREWLLALCEAHGAPLLEDGYEEEMQYSGVTVLPIKSMDRARLVAYCGTFSKALFPGLRVGWLVADRSLVERAAAVYRCTELSSPVLLQAVLAELCRDGIYDRHLARMHRTYRRRMAVLLEALAAHVAPEWAQWEPPQGGFLVWLRLAPLPPGIGAEAVEAQLAAHRVAAASGRFFFASRRDDVCLRLSISALSSEEIEDGVRRLGRALAAIYGEGSTV
jgi:DNA-binding transcriptional MocR family regulator